MGITKTLQTAGEIAKTVFSEKEGISISFGWGSLKITTTDKVLVTYSILRRAMGIAETFGLLMYIDTNDKGEFELVLHEE